MDNLCKRCYHNYVCEQYNENRDFKRTKCDYKNSHFVDVADVAPVRHGKWTTTSGEVFPGSSQFLCYSHKHEECGFQYVDMAENEYDYCPKCGCKMLEDSDGKK